MAKSNHNQLGENIKFYRQQNNLTQEELANKIFSSSSAVSRWEKGNRDPDFKMLKALAKVFDISIDELSNREFQTVASKERIYKNIKIMDFSQFFNKTFFIFKIFFWIVSILLVLFINKASIEFTALFSSIGLIFFVLTVIHLFFQNKYLYYSVGLNDEYCFKKEENNQKKDYQSLIQRIKDIFIITSQLIIFLITYAFQHMVDPNQTIDIIVTIIIIVIIVTLGWLILIDEVENKKSSIINSFPMSYRTNLNLRKTIILISELVYLYSYTTLLYFGKEAFPKEGYYITAFFAFLIMFTSYSILYTKYEYYNKYKLTLK